jgi:hypothetical protein
MLFTSYGEGQKRAIKPIVTYINYRLVAKDGRVGSRTEEQKMEVVNGIGSCA